MSTEHGIKMSNITGQNVVVPRNDAAQPPTYSRRAKPINRSPRIIWLSLIVFAVFACFKAYVNISLMVIHQAYSRVSFRKTNGLGLLSITLKVYNNLFKATTREMAFDDSVGCMLSKAGRLQAYAENSAVYTGSRKQQSLYAHERTTLNDLDGNHRGHGDSRWFLRGTEGPVEGTSLNVRDCNTGDIQASLGGQLDRKKLLPGFYLIPDVSFPVKYDRGCRTLGNSRHSHKTLDSMSSNACEKRSIGGSEDQSKLSPEGSIHSGDIESYTGDTKRLNIMPDSRSVATLDWARMEKQECIDAVCNVDLDYCSGNDISLNNHDKKICRMCAPRIDALILDHCQSETNKEETGAYTLAGILFLLLLIGLSVMIRKQRRGRKAQKIICNEGTELRVLPLGPQTHNSDTPAEIDQPNPWYKRFWLPWRTDTIVQREIASSTDGQLPSRWYHRFRPQPLPITTPNLALGISRLQRWRMEGERDLNAELQASERSDLAASGNCQYEG